MSDPIFTKITPEIQIRILRCHQCGRFWGVESCESGTCPYCAKSKLDAADRETQRLGRVITSLRGVVTRGKKKK